MFLIVPLNFLKLSLKNKCIITFQTITLHDYSWDVLISEPMTMKKID